MLNTLVLAVPLALAVAACSGGSGANGAGSSNSAAKVQSASPEIVIGATLSLTGSLDASGPPLEAGYEVLTDALAKAGDANPGKLNTAISQTDAPTTAGLIKFNQSTHTAITPYFITQWQNGKLNQVQPPTSGVTFDVPTAGLG
jgi:ABC-type branched-subunit amino acid transport system substrate-binding protein